MTTKILFYLVFDNEEEAGWSGCRGNWNVAVLWVDLLKLPLRVILKL